MAKQVLKKVVAAMMVMTVTLGSVQASKPVNAKAETIYNVFKNKYSKEDCGIGFYTEKTQAELLDGYVKKNKKTRYITKGYVVQPKETLYFVAPVVGKLVSAKSSNSKVITVKDASKGLLKANNKVGKTWISYTVKYDYSKYTWSYQKRIVKGAKYSTGQKYKLSKKGKTCTLTYKALVYVSCKKEKHNYGAWKTTEKATCDSSGTKKRNCKKCHHEQTKSIGTTKHKFGAWEVVQATCEDDGYKYRECKVCHESEKVDTQKATGHSYDPVTHKCVKCGQEDPNYDEDANS